MFQGGHEAVTITVELKDFKNLDFGKLLLIFALFIASILFLVFKLFEFMAPFTYLAL